jgi:hypothetical protein
MQRQQAFEGGYHEKIRVGLIDDVFNISMSRVLNIFMKSMICIYSLGGPGTHTRNTPGLTLTGTGSENG